LEGKSGQSQNIGGTKMKKRVSGIFLALAMVLCFASVALFSADGTENIESSMFDTSSMVVNDTVYDDVAQLRAAEDNNSQNGEVSGSVAPTNTDYVEYVENGGYGRGEAHGSIAPINPDYIEYVESGEDENGKIPSMLDLSYLSQRYADSYANSNIRIDLPESYDLRDFGLVGSVPDQGNYGTCWALSALGAAESSLMLRQLTSVTFSEKHLTWFALMGDEETEYIKAARNGREYNPWTAGGTAIQAMACLSAWKGPVYNYKMPYDSFDVVPDESLRYEADFHLQDCVYAYIGDYNISILHDVADAPSIQIIKQLVLENGGYEVSYHAEWYGNRYFNESTSAIYHDDVTNQNHANLIVGWDDNYSKENFSSDCQPENDGAWLVRNSYGTGWGDEGYFWLSYEDKSIVMQGTSYTFEDKDNYATNYQYDTNGWTVSVAADDFIDTTDASKVAYISNIFTAEKDEQLEAVSFYTTDVGTEYEISVYTGVKNGNPVSGTLAYSGQTGCEEYCGYHTIELDSAVALAAGTNFSVVVKLTNPEYAYPIAAEAVIATTNPQYNGNGGESYYSADGKSWTDIVELGKYAINQKKASQQALYTTNVCLKAFTNPLPESGEAIGNVDFSLFEGEVALGSELELSGAENIYYTVTPLGGTEGAVMQYRCPITISESCTITAWGEKNGKIGNKVSKMFTKQVSQLLELAIKAQG
jgi:C1A family cysteine protease